MPETRYARSGAVEIAFQTVGEGPIDLVWVAGFVTHLDVLWEDPSYRRFCEQLGAFSRLIMFDKRGMGLSERVRVATLEERMDDVRAVMDAIDIRQAAVIGMSEGGPMSVLFAATYPERTRALILCGGEVKEERTEDWPWGEATWKEWEGWMVDIDATWGREDMFWHIAPSTEGDTQVRDWWNRMMRNAMNPSASIEFTRMGMGIDIRDVLPAVNVPTLILHRTDDQVCHVENARYMASHIRDAKYVELPGNDHAPWVNGGNDILAEIQEFLTGVREPVQPDRVLATVMFTDIVGSTALATERGDRRWAELLERHHAIVRGELGRFRGHEVDTVGDGFFATFDGPARAIRCARAISSSVRGLGIQVRSGIHSGECELLDGKVGGIAVHTGARVASFAGPGEVLVSGTVKDLVAGSGVAFADRGRHALKGIPGEWQLYEVVDD